MSVFTPGMVHELALLLTAIAVLVRALKTNHKKH
jgi:hypothetical protein